MSRVFNLAIAVVVAAAAPVWAEEGVYSSAEEAKPLVKGDRIPDVEVLDLEGEKLKLRDIVAEKPAAIIFYRGGWCPFCTKHLKDMGRHQDELKELGFQVIAISPDSPENLAEHMEKKRLNFDHYSDSGLEVSKAFGLAFRLAPDVVSKYKDSYKIDLKEWSGGTNEDVLPVPALYLVDSEGKIVFAYTNPDYRERIDAEEVLNAAKMATKKDS